MCVFHFHYLVKFDSLTVDVICTGRVTSFKEHTEQHTMSFHCKYHKDCRVLKVFKKLPADFQVSFHKRYERFQLLCFLFSFIFLVVRRFGI